MTFSDTLILFLLYKTVNPFGINGIIIGTNGKTHVIVIT